MKSACMGSFMWEEQADYYDECGNLIEYTATRVVPWDLCKQIYKRMAYIAATSSFNPDWDLLVATQASLREHMRLLNEYQHIINELELLNPHDSDAVITLQDIVGELDKTKIMNGGT